MGAHPTEEISNVKLSSPVCQRRNLFFHGGHLPKTTFLCDEPCRRWLRETIIYTRQRYPFKIDAWVLLPDHLHCVWTLPENDDDFSMRWNIIKKRFSQTAKSTLHQTEFMNKSKHKHRESTIWQRRFWEHQIRDDEDYRYHIQYTHYNPVKQGLVKNPDDWQYSTIQRYI